jgi:hypothetical protein
MAGIFIDAGKSLPLEIPDCAGMTASDDRQTTRSASSSNWFCTTASS